MATTRRIPVRQPLKSTQLPNPTTVDQLANQLTTKLAITEAKGRSKVGEPPADSKLVSMRAVNTASQALSGIVQTGWKKSTSDASSKVTLSTVIASEASATKHLTILRSISPGEVDVERAATSVLGKLITLEMFHLADKALTEIHSGLCTLMNTSQTALTSLSVPIPSTLPTDPIILNLIATYLSYALVIKARLAAESAKSTHDFATLLDASTTRSLLTWLPNFGALPAKSLDGMLTRAYTAINKLCSSSSTPSPNKAVPKTKPLGPTASPESLFNLRLYALRCLVHTSPGVIGAHSFWDQAIRSVTSFVKTASSPTEEETTYKILSVLSELAQLAENRSDRQTFMGVGENGQSFVEMCEYWMTFAKRAGDISVLQKIDALMQQPSTSSNPPSPIKFSQNPPPTTNTHHSPDLILEGTKICNAFAQLSLLLETPQTDADETLVASIKSSIRLLQSSSVSVLLQPSPKTSERRSRDEEQLSRMCGKVDRAFEKLRRISIKYLESLASSSTSSTAQARNIEDALRKFLLQCVAALEPQAASSDSTASTTRDILTRCIDTLFVLSRTVLAVNNPQTFVPAFEQLTRAVAILDSVPAKKFTEDLVDVANYTRCISGAFYNLAGSLYQATRYGNAVPFLIEACSLGIKALQLPRPEQRVVNETREKEWTQIEEQLFRRWELLAVCYSKNGDRKNAYNAFKQAIHAFPFALSGLKSQSDRLSPVALFGDESSSAIKQLVTLVDKVTYLGACDLLLPPAEISLLSTCDGVSSAHLSDATIVESSITGALLERQLDSLEPNRWKESTQAVFIRLLSDALQIYSETMPMRRARILIRCMEFMYRDRGEEACRDLGVGSVDEIGQQVEHLCTRQTWGQDTQLAHFAPQYRIAAHLWIALHVHRRADPGQTAIVSQRADEACQIMKALLTCGSDTSPKAPRHATSSKVVKKIRSPKVSRVASPRTTRATRQRVPAAPRKAAPAKGKSKANADPMTPKVQTKALQHVTFTAVKTPPREPVPRKHNAKPILEFDDFDRFLSLLQSSARVLGFLSLILTKARLLDMTRQLAQQQSGTTSDGYVIASLDLAHEYANLGKLRRAANIFNQTLDIVRNGQASEEAAIRLLLRFAGSLALFEDVPKSSSIYLEALEFSKVLDLEREAVSMQQRVHSRAKLLEISATAAHVFALVQFAGDDLYAFLEGLLQALRLWNRAVDTLARLNPPRETSPSSGDSDPFEMSSLKDALPLPASGGSTQGERVSKKPAERRTPLDGLEWRISEGLLSTMLALAQAYYMRGSAREAEYFARQAAELAEHLNAPAAASRALARQGEIQMHMGHMEDAQASLTKAADLLCHIPGIDAANIHRLKAELNSRLAGEESLSVALNATLLMLEELDESFSQLDSDTFRTRRSLTFSPKNKDHSEVLAPELLASILSQQLWCLRDDVDDNFNSLLEKFLALPYSTHSKAEENILMAKLTLHGVYDRFRTDMFLSSLTESPIAVPIGMGCKDQIRSMIPSAEISNALANAEKLLWAHLRITAVKGNVVKVREAATSLVLIGAFRTSLGDRRVDIPSIIMSLLDSSAALTLRRDILEAIEHKFPPRCAPDDLQWPLLCQNGISIPQPNLAPATSKRLAMSSLSDSEDDDDVEVQTNFVKQYWDTVREKYKSQVLDPSVLSSTVAVGLPSSWTIINISVTSDKGTLFIARQEGGRECKDPFIFCIPLKGRRDQSNNDDDEQLLTFDGAIQELHAIIRFSDECTKSAINIKSDDDEGRSNWWKQRGQLDVRMRELLENIEYCWLGAFKAILNPQPEMSAQAISDLRGQFENVFHRALRVKDKKLPKAKTSVHKKSVSQSQSNVPSQFTLDDSMVKCFSTLSPKCRDEELEDLIYFVLDLYQFHGVPIAIAEVDILQLVIDLRAVLEEYAAKASRQNLASKKHTRQIDEHIFLVLDKNVQGLPWESMPILRGRSVSRIPGIQFLQDRLAFAKWKRESNGLIHEAQDGAVVDRRNGYYILNPSGDLNRTEERFRNWTSGMKAWGWDGIIGKKLTEQQFVTALKSRDLVVYFGHGGGEQYVRSHMIRNLPTCAATMLWGCSSGALRDMGDFDRTGTPYNYMLAGCPTLVANLWDVTDKDIDKISQSVFDKLGLTGREEQQTRTPTSLVAAVAQSRDSCKLKYLTGAAPVVYGIPFYL